MVQKINSRLFAKIHLDKLLSEDRTNELISIVDHYFSSKPYVMAKLLARYEAEIKTKTKKQTKGNKNEKSEGSFKIIRNDTFDDTIK